MAQTNASLMSKIQEHLDAHNYKIVSCLSLVGIFGTLMGIEVTLKQIKNELKKN